MEGRNERAIRLKIRLNMEKVCAECTRRYRADMILKIHWISWEGISQPQQRVSALAIRGLSNCGRSGRVVARAACISGTDQWQRGSETTECCFLPEHLTNIGEHNQHCLPDTQCAQRMPAERCQREEATETEATQSADCTSRQRRTTAR